MGRRLLAAVGLAAASEERFAKNVNKKSSLLYRLFSCASEGIEGIRIQGRASERERACLCFFLYRLISGRCPYKRVFTHNRSLCGSVTILLWQLPRTDYVRGTAHSDIPFRLRAPPATRSKLYMSSAQLSGTPGRHQWRQSPFPKLPSVTILLATSTTH